MLEKHREARKLNPPGIIDQTPPPGMAQWDPIELHTPGEMLRQISWKIVVTPKI